MSDQSYDAWEIGKAHVLIKSKRYPCVFHLGRIVTGRYKETSGFFIRVTLPDGDIVQGEDAARLRKALYRVAENLLERGITLCAIGLSERFSESEESRNTGMGFVPNREIPVHMMNYR